jgi:hypothetical protein
VVGHGAIMVAAEGAELVARPEIVPVGSPLSAAAPAELDLTARFEFGLAALLAGFGALPDDSGNCGMISIVRFLPKVPGVRQIR